MDDFHPLLIYDGGEKTKPLEESREREKPRLDPPPILQMRNLLYEEKEICITDCISTRFKFLINKLHRKGHCYDSRCVLIGQNFFSANELTALIITLSFSVGLPDKQCS